MPQVMPHAIPQTHAAFYPHRIEELVAEVRQTTNRELASKAVNSKPTERAMSASELSEHVDFKDKKDETQGNLILT